MDAECQDPTHVISRRLPPIEMHKLLSVVSLVLLAKPVISQAAVWGQCGGSGWGGATTCASGSVCTYSNPYYSQCIPGSSSVSTTVSSSQPSTRPSSTTTSGSSAPTGSLPAVGYNQLSNFGQNPTNIEIFSYRPKKLAASPAVVLALHPCGGTAQMYYTSTTYAQLAETYGYYILFGDSNRSQHCWDVNTNETLAVHNGGGDALGLANAVRYSIANWGVPTNKAFVTGSSSGAMMTNVMAAAYPDIFNAAAVDSGVPYGCWAGPDTQSACPRGQDIRTPQAWGDVVRSADPGYSGPRPRIQLYHGTADTLLYPQNFWEEIKEWTNVFGYTQTPISNTSIPGYPSTYSNATYGPNLQAILAQGVGHYVPVAEDLILKFFGIE